MADDGFLYDVIRYPKAAGNNFRETVMIKLSWDGCFEYIEAYKDPDYIFEIKKHIDNPA